MKRNMLFFVSLSLSLFIFAFLTLSEFTQSQSLPNPEPRKADWFIYNIQNETDKAGGGNQKNVPDGIPDVYTNVTFVNDTFVEIYIIDTVEKQAAYKWSSAICNVSGVDRVGKWEYNSKTDVWTYTGLLNYGRLINYGMNSTWCSETGNYGFILFSSGSSGSRQYRLNFTEGHKDIQIYTGQGSEIKEMMTTSILNVHNLMDWNRVKKADAKINGTYYYGNDIYLTLEMESTNVSVRQDIITKNSNLSQLYSMLSVMHKFNCFNYTTESAQEFCPSNITTIEKIGENFAKIELTNNITFSEYSFSLPYLLVDNYSGNLTSYTSTSRPTEDEIFNNMRLKGKGYDSFNQSGNFIMNFNYSGTSHCIQFPISKFSIVNLNVIMLSNITNFTIPEEYILKSTINNSNLMLTLNTTILKNKEDIINVEVCS